MKIRLKELWEDSLMDLCSSNSDFVFAEKTKYWAERIFNVSNIQFLFVEKNKLIRHLSASSFEEFSAELGVAGSVAQTQKPCFIHNLKNSSLFNTHVDLKTLMSVLTFPALEDIVVEGIKEKKCLGILQIPLKDVGKVRAGENEKENVEAWAGLFGKTVEMAFKYYRREL